MNKVNSFLASGGRAACFTLLLLIVSATGEAQVVLDGCAGGDFGDACSLEELNGAGSNGSISIHGTVFDNFLWSSSCCIGSLGPLSEIRVDAIDSTVYPGLVFTDTGSAWSRGGLTVALNMLTFDILAPTGQTIYGRHMFAEFGSISGFDLVETDDSSVFIKDRMILNNVVTGENEAGVQCFASEMPVCENTTRRDSHPGTQAPNFTPWDDVTANMEFNVTAITGGSAEIDRFTYRLDMQSDHGLFGLQDVDINNLPEVGVITQGGSTHLHVRDVFSGLLVNDIDLGDDPVIEVLSYDDIGFDATQDIAILGRNSGGNVRVQFRDGLTGAVAGNLFYGAAYSPISMRIVPDVDLSGFAEIAVMGEDAGSVRIQGRDPVTHSVPFTAYFGNTALPVDHAAIPDVSGNGSPEILMLGQVFSNGIARARAQDTATFGIAGFLGNIYFGAAFTPLALVAIGDVSGDGVADLAQLGRRDDTGAVRIQVKRSDTFATVSNAYLGTAYVPLQMMGIDDANNSGSPDVAVLLENPLDGTARVTLRDGATGAPIRKLFFGSLRNPRAMTVIDDANANGVRDIAVLGDNDGMQRVQIRDPISSANVGVVDFP